MGPHLLSFVTMVTTVCPTRDQLVDPGCDPVMGVMRVHMKTETKQKQNRPCSTEI